MSELRALDRIRVLHVIPTVGPRYGGASVACMELCRALAAKGADVVVYTTNIDRPEGWNSAEGEPLLIEGVQYYFFNAIGPKYYWFSPGMFRAFRREISTFDVVHIHSLYRAHLPLAVHFCRKYGVPFVLKPHGSLDPYLFGRRRWRKWPHEMLFERRAFADAAAVHFTSKEEQLLAATTNVFDDRLQYHRVVVPSGVVIPEGLRASDSKATDFFEKFPETRGKDIVLFLSRINFKKGLDILVRAFGIVSANRKNAHLVIVGPDNEGYAKRVKKWLKEEKVLDRTTFTGMLLGGEKEAAFKAAKVFVLPSYTENFGIAILEASSAGLPVVISNKVNIWREIKAAGAGIVVDCDAQQTANAILRILDDQQLGAEMGRCGAELVKTRFTWDVAAEETLALYRRVGGRRTGRHAVP